MSELMDQLKTELLVQLKAELSANCRLRLVNVMFEDGFIVLTGNTTSYFAKQVAQQIAMKYGRIKNKISVVVFN